MSNQPALRKPIILRAVMALAISIVLLVITNIQGQTPNSDVGKKEPAFPSARIEAEANQPPPNYGSIYVLRPRSIVGALGCFGLTIDGRLWGSLNNGEYAWDPISPGNHVMGRARPNQYHLHVDAGKTYYIALSAGGLASGGVKFLSEAEGEKIRRRLKLNGTRWLLHQYLANWPKVRIGMTFAEVNELLELDDMYRLVFSYARASSDVKHRGSNVYVSSRRNEIPVVPVQKITIYRSNVLWYSLRFRGDALFAKRDAQLSPTDYPSVENLESITFSGTVSGEPYVGGILDENGIADIPLSPLRIPFCGVPEWY